MTVLHHCVTACMHAIKKKKVTLYFNVFVLQLLNMYVLSNNCNCKIVLPKKTKNTFRSYETDVNPVKPDINNSAKKNNKKWPNVKNSESL